MLPRPGERFQTLPDNVTDYDERSWDRFPVQGMVEVLRQTVQEEWEKSTFNQAQLTFNTRVGLYKEEAQIRNESSALRDDINRFLFTASSNHQVLSRLENHLSALAFLGGQSGDLNIFAYHIEQSLGSRAFNYLKQVVDPSLMRQEAPTTDQPPDMNYRDLMMMDVILRNVASFGLWRAIELSKTSKDVWAKKEGKHKGRAFVGAVAMDTFGNVLATGYRGEGRVSSMHAENVMLNKLAQRGLLNQVTVTSVSLEPCLQRSEKHAKHLGHTKGCSQLLVEANIPIVAYLLRDENRKGNGTGTELLADHNRLVYAADHPLAIALESFMQHLPWLHQFYQKQALQQFAVS